MAEWTQPVGFDPVNGVYSDLVKEGGEYILRHRGDAQALIDENKKLNTQPQRRGMRLAARTPVHLEYQWMVEFEAQHGANPGTYAGPDRRAVRDKWKRFKVAKLNSPEFSHLRTDGGRKL